MSEYAAEKAALDMAMVERAIDRIEESRQSHAEWAEHIPNCAHCLENGPPPYIQSQAEHEQIVAEYDEVLTVLRARVIPLGSPDR